jgi:hypothetical protein
MKIVDIVEGAVADFEKDLQHPHSYDAIDHMMQTIARKHSITPDKLHDIFVKRHGVTPDDWIKQRLDELSFLGSPCTKDCSGHRAGYAWSRARGNVHAASWSPSFNNGAALAVAGK